MWFHHQIYESMDEWHVFDTFQEFYCKVYLVFTQMVWQELAKGICVFGKQYIQYIYRMDKGVTGMLSNIWVIITAVAESEGNRLFHCFRFIH